jgi:hypothetical protein
VRVPAATAASSTPQQPLSAADLEKRAREHEAAKRWVEAAADYSELLRRFPEHPRRNEWLLHVEQVLRAAAQAAPGR